MVLLPFFLVFVAYAFILLRASVGINKKILADKYKSNEIPSFSLIIPFRNEAENLKSLLTSLTELSYKRECFEIILVNDHSEDNFECLLNNYRSSLNFNLLHLNEFTGKKQAILSGIKSSNFAYIITLDADCIVPTNLLTSYGKIISAKKSDLIIGSVALTADSSFIQKFQQLDYLAMQGVGLGWANLNRPILCSGANLCYSKSVFLSLKPFQENLNISSGDDLFTLFSFLENKKKISTNLEATVNTKSLSSWGELAQQRKRWLSKNNYLSNRFYKLVSGIIFSCNFSLIILFCLSVYDLFWLEYLFIFFVIKFLLDYFLLYQTAYKLNQFFCWKDILKISIIYPFALVYTLFYSFKINYIWKNRMIDV